MNEAITQSEAVLKALNPVDETWIECGGTCDDDGDPETERKVGFSKVAGKWRLMHYTHYCQENRGSTSLLTDVPISHRLDAALRIPALQEKIVKEKEHFIGKVNDAVLMLKSLKS